MWRRLPTYFPNIRLAMLPLSPEAKEQLVATGWLREVAFKTEPRVNKVRCARFCAVGDFQTQCLSRIGLR